MYNTPGIHFGAAICYCKKLSRKLTHWKKVKHALKATYKKAFLKYQPNARFLLLCLASGNAFWSKFYSKNLLQLSRNDCIGKQEAQGLGALLDKMEGNDHIKLDNKDLDVAFHSKTCRFRGTGFLKIGNTPNDPTITLST